LSRLSDQDLTHAVTGIFRNVRRETYDDAVRAQVADAHRSAVAVGGPDLGSVLRGGDAWTVGG
jgi:2-oxoglutarate ferredoxin oxidoreductase subunit beta